jgi:hypothetical protein
MSESMYADAASIPAGEGFSTGLIAPPESGGGTAASMSACDFGSDVKAAIALVTGSKLNLLLVFCPLGMAAEPMGLGASMVFFLNFLVRSTSVTTRSRAARNDLTDNCVLSQAIIPLAKILGDATEELAVHVGQTLGGLLNATFGNAVEMIMAVFALQAGLIEVVQGTLLGSILSNLLLVLGCCFVAGGLKYKTQEFNATSATANSSLLLVACMALVLPTCFSVVGKNGCVTQEANMTFTSIVSQHDWEEACFKGAEDATVSVSRMTSVLLGAMYTLLPTCLALSLSLSLPLSLSLSLPPSLLPLCARVWV